MLRMQLMQYRLNFMVSDMFAKKCLQPACRIREKCQINEIDWSCRAFDVQKNYLDLGFAEGSHISYLTVACGGKYLGPQQTGS